MSVRTWAALTEACAVASVMVLPYTLKLLEQSGQSLEDQNRKRVAAGKRPIAPVQVVGLTMLNAQLTFGIAAALGLRAARSLGLGTPHMEAALHGRRPALRPSDVWLSVSAGAAAALLTRAMDSTLFRSVQEQFRRAGIGEPGVWRSLLATPYGAIAEEVLMRLGAQSLIATVLRPVLGDRSLPPAGRTMWPAIILSNLLFGAGHLPMTKALIPLSPLVVVRGLVLNTLPGVVFGYLYWKRSLEAAMIAHGAADIVLHGGGALLQRRSG